MNTSPLDIRPLFSQDEYDFYCRLTNTAFSPQPSEEGIQRRKHFIKESPEFYAEQVRGAFRDGQLMGGYIMYGRVLRMGTARLSTGCIGGVVTSPEYRRQGVASVLMQDAISFASSRGYVLNLLDGIPKFYFRYGYIDVFDATTVEIDIAAILAQSASSYHVRSATREDEAALLALYNRHYAFSTGSFERSPEMHAHRLRFTQTPPLVSCSPQGEIAGYLFYETDSEDIQGREVAADSWDALLALLQYHAHLCGGGTRIKSLVYLLRPDLPMVQWMIDRLEVPDTSLWTSPVHEWGVRSHSYHHRFTGWMGRLINFSLLMPALLPELQARWQHALASWTGEVALIVEDQQSVLRLAGATVQLAETAGLEAYRVELSQQALMQWVFGYRPLASLTDTTLLSPEASAALAILFPANHTWIPGTDWF